MLATVAYDRPALAHDLAGLWLMEERALTALMARMTTSGPVQAAMRSGSTMSMRPGRGGKNIAIITANGVMAKAQPWFGGVSTVQLRQDIRNAKEDTTVSGILLAIDSPGGTAAGTAELGAEVKAARKKKPVYSFVEDMTASAAYWMASQSDMIFASNATAEVGSIGTAWAVPDFPAALEKDGIKVHLFSTGPFKGMGTFGTPVTAQHAENFQSLVNEKQTWFDAAVRSGRGLSPSQLAAVRTGAVFPATEAMGLKLIDGIKTFEGTFDALAAAR